MEHTILYTYIMPEINANNIKAAGFEFEQLDPNVFLIKDFITEEECQVFYNYAETRTEEDWLGSYLEGIKDRVEARYGDRDPDARLMSHLSKNIG